MNQAFIGSIVLVGFNYAPEGWALCNGQTLQIMQNQVLFAVIGTTYGGDGRTTFALPKLDASALQQGLNYVICVNGVFPSRP